MAHGSHMFRLNYFIVHAKPLQMLRPLKAPLLGNIFQHLELGDNFKIIYDFSKCDKTFV
jgi:hypothetical protein